MDKRRCSSFRFKLFAAIDSGAFEYQHRLFTGPITSARSSISPDMWWVCEQRGTITVDRQIQRANALKSHRKLYCSYIHTYVHLQTQTSRRLCRPTCACIHATTGDMNDSWTTPNASPISNYWFHWFYTVYRMWWVPTQYNSNNHIEIDKADSHKYHRMIIIQCHHHYVTAAVSHRTITVVDTVYKKQESRTLDSCPPGTRCERRRFQEGSFISPRNGTPSRACGKLLVTVECRSLV